jgi:hypothetical protein
MPSLLPPLPLQPPLLRLSDLLRLPMFPALLRLPLIPTLLLLHR